MTLTLSAQESGDIQTVLNQYAPTPKALSMIRYGCLPVDLNSGTMSLEIPIGEYKDQDFSIPVSLRYSSSGFKPASPSGEAGLGWSLAAGGAITREIVGVDDFRTGGYFSSSHFHHPDTVYQLCREVYYSNGFPRMSRTEERELSSDIYHFSFPGHSGSFVIDHNGHFTVFASSGGRGTYDIQYGSMGMGGFTIKTADGMTWCFGVDPSNREYMLRQNGIHDKDAVVLKEADGDLPTVTWLLEKIIAPDGRTAVFSYTGVHTNQTIPSDGLDDVITTFSQGYNRQGDSTKHKFASLVATVYLQDIKIKENETASTSKTIASFSWERKNYREVEDNIREQPYKKMLARTRRLLSVSLSEGSTPLRTATLSYDDSRRRPLLTSVTIPPVGTWKMDYYLPPDILPLPGQLSDAVDLWGYYNGKTTNSETLVAPTIVNTFTYDEYLSTDQMDPDASYSVQGMLRKVTWPTGGSTTITYESNQASRIVLRRRLPSADPYPFPGPTPPSTPPFTPSVESYSTVLHSMDCGGVRVSQIEEDNLTDGVFTRSFSYIDSTGNSTGIVQEFKRYYVGMIGDRVLYNSYLRYPGNGFTRRHVAYTSVVETFSDSTSERTDFSSWLDEPDEFSPYSQAMDQTLPDGTSDACRLFMNNILREGDSREYRRGLPLRKTLYDESGSVLRREEYTYADIGEDQYAAYVVGSGEYWWSARRFLADRVMVSSQTTLYPDLLHGVTSSRSFTYDNAGRIISSSVTDSDGAVRTARTSYLSYPLQPSLVSSVVNTVRRPDSLAVVRTDSTRFSYSHSGNFWNRTQAERYVFNQTGTADLRDNILYTSFDAYGHARQMTVNGDDAAFVWGYGGRYPVAVIRNCTLSELPSGLQQTLSGGLSTAQVKTLYEMTGKEVHVYKYNPSIGVIQAIGPSGRSLSYLYDGYARLVQEKDAAGTLLRRYVYGSEAWDGNTQLRYLESQTSTGAGTRAERTLYDGLGREWMLSVRKNGTINPTHKVTLLQSDGLDRKTRTYLPYAAGDVSAGSAYIDQAAFWNSLYPGEGASAFAESAYSGGPMALPATETLPGQTMRSAGKHTVWNRSVNGAAEVPRLVYNSSDGSVTVSGHYPEGTLIREEITAPDGELAVTFTTAEGVQILSRTISGNEWHDTYIVRDGHDRTAWVVGPGLGETIRMAAAGSPLTIDSESNMADVHCYIYGYDGKGDIQRIHRSGAGTEEFSYDSAHRLKTWRPSPLRQSAWQHHDTGPALLSSSPKVNSSYAYIEITYDRLGRRVEESLFKHETLVSTISGETSGSVVQPSIDSKQNTLTEYVYAQSSSVDCITSDIPGTPYISIPEALSFSSRVGFPSESDSHITGELILQKQYPLSGPVVPLGVFVEINGWDGSGMVGDTPARSAYYYDGKGRVIQQVTQWPDGGLTRLSRAYDLEGKVVRELEEHRPSGAALSATDWLWSDYTYDTRGNLLSTTTRCGRGTLPTEEDASVTFSGQFTYDGIDRRTGRSITSSGHTLSVGENSTLQGWRSSCAYQLDSQPVFSESLKYWNPDHTAVSGRYGGQISETESLHAGYPSRVEGYAYDGFGRLSGTMAWLGGGSTAGTVNIEDGITYDALGGILSLSRKGPDGMAVSRLGMTRSGGRVTSVRDSTTNQTWSYQYASDGTLKKDTRAGYEYADNLLGLIAQVGFRRGGHSFDYETAATYSYLPDGTKLDVTKSDSSAVLYRGHFTYRRSAAGEITLESIAAPEGIILATGGGTVWTPYTLVTDRLGSVRALVDMSSGTVVERNDYYPYGKRIAIPSTLAGSYPQLATNRWRFSGKEEQDTLALTPYLDFGARQYDPEVATWLAPDPLSTDYPSLSPYVYCAGDPVNLVDPKGKSPIYDPKGNFLGTDQYGLSGRWIVLNPALFYQGMLHVDASNLSVRPESKEAWDMISAHYNNLPSRPDYDGYVTAIEGIRWAKNHPNALKSPTPDNTLYIDASKLDFGILSTTDFPEEGESYPQNLFNAFNVFWANNNPVLFDTVYALGRFDAVLIDRHERTIRIVNHGEATNYDWNTGGGRIRNTFIKVNNFLFNINPEIHGVKVYYYGKGRLHH